MQPKSIPSRSTWGGRLLLRSVCSISRKDNQERQEEGILWHTLRNRPPWHLQEWQQPLLPRWKRLTFINRCRSAETASTFSGGLTSASPKASLSPSSGLQGRANPPCSALLPGWTIPPAARSS